MAWSINTTLTGNAQEIETIKALIPAVNNAKRAAAKAALLG